MSEQHFPWRERIGALVLGHLSEEEEEASVRAHLDGCPDCSREARELQPVVAALAAADPERVGASPAPPPGLEERVFGRLEEERGLARARRRRFGARVAAALAAAAAMVAAFLYVSGGDPPPGGDVEVVAFVALPPGAQADAELRPAGDDLEVHLRMRGLPSGDWIMAVERADGSEVESELFRAPSGSWHGRRTFPVTRHEAVALKIRLVGGTSEFTADLSRAA